MTIQIYTKWTKHSQADMPHDLWTLLYCNVNAFGILKTKRHLQIKKRQMNMLKYQCILFQLPYINCYSTKLLLTQSIDGNSFFANWNTEIPSLLACITYLFHSYECKKEIISTNKLVNGTLKAPFFFCMNFKANTLCIILQSYLRLNVTF